jgi:hypothetical protein
MNEWLGYQIEFEAGCYIIKMQTPVHVVLYYRLSHEPPTQTNQEAQLVALLPAGDRCLLVQEQFTAFRVSGAEGNIWTQETTT